MATDDVTHARRFAAEAGSVRAARHFVAAAGSVRAARHFVAEAVTDAPADVREAVALMVSELATNAIKHAASGYEVAITPEAAGLRVAVTDEGGGNPELRAPGPDDLAGRGLAIVDMLAETWGVTRNASRGKTVFFTVSVSAGCEPTAQGPHELDAELPRVFSGSGAVGRDLVRVDWEKTPLGPVESWPRSLATVVSMVLTSRFSMWMAWGPELTFFCNDAYRRDTLGKKYPWALGRSAREVWEEIWPEIGPRIENVLSTGEATWDEALMLFLERSGYREETYHTFSYSPLSGEDGQIAGMLCVVTEDTDRVIGERRLATLRELGSVSTSGVDEYEYLRSCATKLAANSQSLPFTISYLFDDDGSARFASASGIAQGHPAAPAQISIGDPHPLWPLAAAAAGEATVVELDAERFGRLPTGAWDDPPEVAIVTAIPHPAGGRPYGFLVVGVNRFRPVDDVYRSFVELIARDLAAGVAAARSFEAERRRAEQLVELDRAKTVFFSNISHEFRTPLTLMLAPLQDALADPRGLAPDQLDLVHRNALRLLKLVNSLLDFSRAEAGRMRAQFQPVDLGALTAELASAFKDASTRAGIELNIDVDTNARRVYVDPELWERIVLNLLSNAFKVTVAGSITVELHERDGSAVLSLIDTGPGIPPDEQQQLFQRFHRVRSLTARSYEGSGIGLALVKELTDLHGGEVSLQSEVGVGSRFSVSVPLGHDHLPAAQVADVSRAPRPTITSLFVEEAMGWLPTGDLDRPLPHESDQFGSRVSATLADRRVLVADDNPDLRRYLTWLLSPHFTVEAVNDGVAALELARQHPPDLVISDVMMPKLDGYGLLAALREAPETREVPVIILSARAGEEAAIEGLGAGADDYLPKPFSGRELLARARAHLELSALRRQTSAELRAERFRLEQTLQQLPAGVVLADAPSGRIVLSNARMDEIIGHTPASAHSYDPYPTGRGFTLEGEPVAADQWPLARAIRTGQVIEEQDMFYITDSGRRIIMRTSAGPIRDESGDVFAGVAVFQDVTERVRSERLLETQRDVLALIANGAPLQQPLSAIVKSVEALAEFDFRGSILLISEDGRTLRHGAAPSLPDAYNEAIDGLTIGPAVGSCGTAAYRNRTVVVTDIETDPLWTGYRELAEEHGLRSCWSTPIRATDGEVVGTFALYHDQPIGPTEADRRLVELLTRTAAVAIGRARDTGARTRQLAELQSSLLPHALPHVEGLGAAVSFHPGDRGLDVGGDFYDLFALPDSTWGIVIGDVCGHGAAAAAVTALTRHTTRAVARLAPDPGVVLSVVNDALRNSEYDRYCTAVYGWLKTHEHGIHITLASGGHPPPLVRRADGSVETLDDHGPLIGVLENAEFPTMEVELGPGDTLLLYTDGLIERNPRVSEDGGLGGLLGSLRSAEADGMIRQLERQALGPPPLGRLRDDIAVFALQASSNSHGS
jgi:PAS domain S-box-containing protein